MLESIFGRQCTQAALTALKPNKKNSAQSNPQALPLEALCYLSSGDLAAARQTIAKLNDLNSTEPLATFATGYLAYKDGDYKKALSALNSAAAKDKSLFPAQLIAAKINLKQGDVIEATSQARELRKISGLLPQALALELTCRLKQDDLDKSNLTALKTDVLRLNQSLSENDQSKGAIDLALGRLALTEGKLADAKSYFAKAQNLMATTKK
jgi:Flp pilus assembly protein TadD